jgi:hypothetical protein
MLSILKGVLQDALRLAKATGTPLIPPAAVADENQIAIRRLADPLAFRLREAIGHVTAVETREGASTWTDLVKHGRKAYASALLIWMHTRKHTGSHAAIWLRSVRRLV